MANRFMRYNQAVMIDSLSLDPAQPATWLLGSVIAAIVAANLAWLIARPDRRRLATGWQIAMWLATALFCIFPPLLAWRAGALSPFYLGLSGLDWIPTLMTGAPVVALVVALVVVGWLVVRRTLPSPAQAGNSGLDRVGAALRAPVDAVLRQWHWAFYRAAAIGWIATAPTWRDLPLIDLTADSVYWGSWLGLLFIAAEWALNPLARAALRSPQTQATALRQIALALATTALFTLTRNLWLCLLCHVAVETIIVGWLARPGVAPAATPHIGS